MADLTLSRRTRGILCIRRASGSPRGKAADSDRKAADSGRKAVERRGLLS